MKNENILPDSQETQSGDTNWPVTRRDFLKASGFFITGLAVGARIAYSDETDRKTKLRFGIVTDSHYANTATRGKRHYRESAAKMAECVKLMNDKKVDFLIEIGDFKDESKPATEKSTLKYLKTIEKIFKKFKGTRYHVLGNHDVDSISKEQFLARVENTGIARESKYYSFDSNGLHFVVLDANYNADGSDYDHGNYNWIDTNIPRKELNWLKKDLASTSKPVIVFVHQQLDGINKHCVKNAAQVCKILQANKKVLAVFQGHNHPGNYSNIQGIHYYTLKAMVEGSGNENNSYAIVEVCDDYSIVVTGYRRAVCKNMDRV